MAKEENKSTGTGEPMDIKKLAAYANQLETRLKSAYSELNEARQQISMYQMQDYYQRAQLLCMVISNEKIGDDLRKRCESELGSLIFPPEPEKGDK